ncbi:MAG TPA: hypothetical protein VMU81_20725 [Acetobacteraceae bacterium]|jgi:hypothetical protein|nr:hypothetical protein [Acetobacteraceae bacterium]
MRDEPALAGTSAGRRPADYPRPNGRHPVYMYGVFRRDAAATCLGSRTDQGMLGIREEEGAVLPDIHLHHHADVRVGDGHQYMFGVAAEQSPVVPPDDPAYYSWGVGSA